MFAYSWQLIEHGGLHENIEEIRQGKVVLSQLFQYTYMLAL
jgi:hypothetical protein